MKKSNFNAFKTMATNMNEYENASGAISFKYCRLAPNSGEVSSKVPLIRQYGKRGESLWKMFFNLNSITLNKQTRINRLEQLKCNELLQCWQYDVCLKKTIMEQ